jgi:hypothetical protein
MSVSVTITNLAAVATPVTEAYVVLGAAGATNDAITIERSVAELDSMRGLKTLVDAGTVSVDAVQSSDNVDLMSIPLEQHGIEAGVDVSAATEVTTAVVFAEPCPTGVTPVITLTADKTAGPLARGGLYTENVTNLGFDLQYDVTTLEAASTHDISWKATY